MLGRMKTMILLLSVVVAVPLSAAGPAMAQTAPSGQALGQVGTPMGQPVGTPMGQPVGTPKGQPMGTPMGAASGQSQQSPSQNGGATSGLQTPKTK